MKKAALAVVMACSVSGVLAQVYVGAGVGMTHANLDCDGTETCDLSSSGGKFYIGYEFAPAISGEVGYISFGTAKMAGYIYVPGYGEYLVHLDQKSKGMTAALALRGDLAPKLSGVARLGLAQIKTEVAIGFTSSDPFYTESETKTKPYVGLALEYAFSKNLKGELAADFTQGEIFDESASLRMVGVGFRYAF